MFWTRSKMLKKVESNGGPIRYRKGGWRVSKARLRSAELGPYFEKENIARIANAVQVTL